MEEENEIGSVDGEKQAIGCLILLVIISFLPILIPFFILVEIYHKLKKKLWKSY